MGIKSNFNKRSHNSSFFAIIFGKVNKKTFFCKVYTILLRLVEFLQIVLCVFGRFAKNVTLMKLKRFYRMAQFYDQID